MNINRETSKNNESLITEEQVKFILKEYKNDLDGYELQTYSFYNASDKMLGFLADYWKLKVYLLSPSKQRIVLSFFIKGISRSNESKAAMAKDCKLFENEVKFYTVILNEIKGLRKWCPSLVTMLCDDAMVFEDLDELQYKIPNKFKKFDMPHTLQALKTLARFHASSLIFEKTRGVDIDAELKLYLNGDGYKETDLWFIQCRDGALEAVQSFSKYSNNEAVLRKIQKKWNSVWRKALDLGDRSNEHHNVICHRDLWSNNIFFHYKNVYNNDHEPDDCLLIDFQGVRCQPPAGDVMLFLYCNVDPKDREENMNTFLNFYYEELKHNLDAYNIPTNDIIPKDKFLLCAEQHRQWGLVVYACLIPQIWIDDDLTTEIFSDTEQYDYILSKHKGRFIKQMMRDNSDYREKVLEVFDEIIERYCLD